MLSIVDDSSSACSVSARSDRLRRSSQTAIGSPARTSNTRMMVMESLLATYPLIRSPKAAGRADSVGESCGGSAGYGAVATISASLSRSLALSPFGGHLVSRLRRSQALAAHFRVNFGTERTAGGPG